LRLSFKVRFTYALNLNFKLLFIFKIYGKVLRINFTVKFKLSFNIKF